MRDSSIWRQATSSISSPGHRRMTCPSEDGSLSEDDGLLRTILFEPHHAHTHLTGKSGTVAAAPDREWSGFLEKAGREGVSAVLFYHLRKYRLTNLCPPEIVDILSWRYHANLRSNLRIIGALREVLTRFQQEDLPCIVLKGMALAERIYPNIALRGMSDVDLLVKKADLLRADACLVRRGYTSRDSTVARAAGNPPGYLMSLEYRRDGASVLNLHLHWHPVNTSVPATAFAERIDLERIWEKAIPARIADSEALMLCPEHLIIYLCEHALRVGHGFDRLILVCDLYFAIEVFEGRIQWPEVVAESRRWNLDRFVYHALTIVKGHTGLTTMDGCLAELAPATLTLWERIFLRMQRNRRQVRGSGYFLHLALHHGLLAKMGFVARTFSPPRQILLQRRAGEEMRSAASPYLGRIGEVSSHLWALIAARWKRTRES